MTHTAELPVDVMQDSTGFEENFSLLASLAMRDTHAKGFALFRQTSAGVPAELSHALGAPISTEVLTKSGPDPLCRKVVTHAVRHHGDIDAHLVFSFDSAVQADTARGVLRRYFTMMERLWAGRSIALAYFRTFSRIVALERELADAKVATVVRGALDGPREDVEIIARQVETLLRPSAISQVLDQLLEERLSEVEERKWTQRAKEILQRLHGMSEGEAHSHLRKVSRQSRRRLLEVARQVVESYAEPAPHSSGSHKI